MNKPIKSSTPAGKIFNPQSHRFVSITGRIGKKIVETIRASAVKTPSPPKLKSTSK
jgi:hypothetical protein